MKRTVHLLILSLVIIGTAHAQVDRPIAKEITQSSVADFNLEPGTNAFFTTPEGAVFTIEMVVSRPDSSYYLTNPAVEVEGRKQYMKVRMVTRAVDIVCPEGAEAAYFTDEDAAYQVGYCVSPRSDPWLGDYFPGVSVAQNFYVGYLALTGRR